MTLFVFFMFFMLTSMPDATFFKLKKSLCFGLYKLYPLGFIPAAEINRHHSGVPKTIYEVLPSVALCIGSTFR